ncbi:MAG: TonB family protein [Proteobacteria bacterium]|nr:TonB family protein [Pseudomonadota bacterium]MBU1714101.1 TonB family protein [Pseudomonadota bacterium]
MKTADRNISVLPVAVLLSMLVNIILFSFQPMISRITSSGQNLDRLIPVKIINQSQKADESLVRESKPEKISPPLTSEEMVPLSVDQDMDLTLPKMQFSINPVLSTGIAVSVPEKTARKNEPMPNSFSLAEVDQPPAPLFQLQPNYPYSAKRSNVTGKVSVMFLVDQTGNVFEVKILTAEPKGIFEESVKSALAKWKFVPGKLEGRSVPTWVATTFRFELD